MPTTDELLTAEQVAQVVKLDRETVHRRARRGDLPRPVLSGPGQPSLWSREQINDWLRDLREAATDAK